MHIEVQKRLKPFDHVPGRFLPLPGSCFSLQVFPALISIYDLRNSEKKCISEIKTSIKGPIKCFTVELDLEKGSILVFGESLEGYFRYRISKCLNEDSLIFEVEKTKGFLLAFQETFGDLKVFKENETEFLISKNKQKLDVFKPSSHEKLFLGVNKALDINKILSRCDLKEIFPLWLRLGNLISFEGKEKAEGTAILLKEAEDLIRKKDLNEVLKPFQLLFDVGFSGFLTPTLIDEKHQGIFFSEVSKENSPLFIFTAGAKLIRSLFMTYEDHVLKVLPVLPTSFHAGRFIHFKAIDLGYINIEWSKKLLRRMSLFVDSSQTFTLKLQKEIKRCRFVEEGKKEVSWIENGSLIEVKKGKSYFIDRFEK